MLRTGQNADCQVGHGGQCEQQIQADQLSCTEVFEEVQKLIEYGDMEV